MTYSSPLRYIKIKSFPLIKNNQFVGSFYFLSIISGYFSDAFLLMIAVNIFFLHRPIYKMQKEKIDKAWNQVFEMYAKYSKIIVEKIPKYVEKKN